MLSGSCHCGAVQIKVMQMIDTLTECNCSACRRYGVQWAYCSSNTAEIICSPATLVHYSWAQKTITFCHCKHCGCLTHYENVDKSDEYRIAVNARMLEPTAIKDLVIRFFDGADTEQYLTKKT